MNHLHFEDTLVQVRQTTARVLEREWGAQSSVLLNDPAVVAATIVAAAQMITNDELNSIAKPVRDAHKMMQEMYPDG